jgi:hypothetical protein
MSLYNATVTVIALKAGKITTVKKGLTTHK